MGSFLDGLHNSNKQRIVDLLAPDATYWIMPAFVRGRVANTVGVWLLGPNSGASRLAVRAWSFGRGVRWSACLLAGGSPDGTGDPPPAG
jgi:hypothetical protein